MQRVFKYRQSTDESDRPDLPITQMGMQFSQTLVDFPWCHAARMSSADDAELVAAYTEALEDLSEPTKANISALTSIAEDNKAYAPTIVGIVVRRLESCPPASKLAALYLLDSVLKTTPDPYTPLIEVHLYSCFFKVWTAQPLKRNKLQKLFQTWEGCVSPDVFVKIQGAVAAKVAASQQRMATAAQQQQQQQELQLQRLQQQQQWGTGDPHGLRLQSHLDLGVATQSSQDFGGPGLAPSLGGLGLRADAVASGGNLVSDPAQLMQDLLASGILSHVSNEWVPTDTEVSFDQHHIRHGAVDVALDRFRSAANRQLHAVREREGLRKSAGDHLHRMWYATIQTWLQVTTAGQFAQDNGKEAQHVDYSIFRVPVDSSQPYCALSGEEFTREWDDNTQSWQYVGVKRLRGPEARSEGVPDGALVLASCMTGGKNDLSALLNTFQDDRNVVDLDVGVGTGSDPTLVAQLGSKLKAVKEETSFQGDDSDGDDSSGDRDEDLDLADDHYEDLTFDAGDDGDGEQGAKKPRLE